MEKMELNSCGFLSDHVHRAFMDMFDRTFGENNDYNDTIVRISLYLMGQSNEYDDIVANYQNVTRDLVKQMVFSNFLEITFYRKESGVPIDKERDNILNAVNTEPQEGEQVALLHCSAVDVARMVNDVLVYFGHPSKIYSYNAVNLLQERKFADKLYKAYPLAVNEHMLTLEDWYTRKEYLYYTLIEMMVNETEKLIFSRDSYPTYGCGYYQEIANLMKEHNGRDEEKPNLHEKAIAAFKSKVDIDSEVDYDKVLIMEMLFNQIVNKHRCMIPTTEVEESFQRKVHKILSTLSDASQYYDENEAMILSSLIEGWNIFPDKVLFTDTILTERIQKPTETTFKKKPQ